MTEFGAQFAAAICAVIAAMSGFVPQVKVAEDDPAWDCATMGDRACAVADIEVDGAGIRSVLVEDHTTTPTLVYRRYLSAPDGRWRVWCDSMSAWSVDTTAMLAMLNSPVDGTCEAEEY